MAAMALRKYVDAFSSNQAPSRSFPQPEAAPTSTQLKLVCRSREVIQSDMS